MELSKSGSGKGPDGPETSLRDDSRSLRILARQQAVVLDEPGFWEGMDNVSIVDENPELASEPAIVRLGLAIRKVLLTMPISIEPDELIVGNFRVVQPGHADLPGYTNAGEKVGIGGGHQTADYQTLVNLGLKGIRAKAQAALEGLGPDRPPDAEHKKGFYRGIIICCDAVRDFAWRYAALAERLGAGESDVKRASELGEIARVCRAVPENPAASFHEALQSVMLYHIAIHNIHFDGAMGRIDQFFYPLLPTDLDRGAITHEEAQELIDCFMLKSNERVRYEAPRRHVPEHAFLINPYGGQFQNVVIAGQSPDGSDATNDVTYMILDSMRRLALVFPTVSVRLHGGSPLKLIRACAEVLRTGAGAPALYNDDVFVPALVKAGVSLEDARDYANDGCWEVTVGGKTNFGYKTFFVASCLEWVLTRGRALPIDWERMTGWKARDGFKPVPAAELSVEQPEKFNGTLVGGRPPRDRIAQWRGPAQPIDMGDPREFRSFEELMSALEAQIDRQIKKIMTDFIAELGDTDWVRPSPLWSALLGDCVEKGRGWAEGGPRYDMRGIDAVSVPNLVDSLCAIRKLVFEEQTLTMAELVDMLESNYEGAEDIRAMLVSRAPKYGNDDEAADAMAARVLDFVADTVEKYSKELSAPEGHRLIWGMLSGTFEAAVMFGSFVGASADGRHASEPFAVNLAPSVGASTRGPTAALQSYTRLPLHRLSIGGPLDLSLDGTTLEGEEGLARMVGLIRSFVELGGNIMTITVVDGDTLRRAQKEPSKYRHLRVRLGGFQAYFVGLSREQQDFQIARVEQKLA